MKALDFIKLSLLKTEPKKEQKEKNKEHLKTEKYGPVIAQFDSSTGDKVYSVRPGGKLIKGHNCNCNGWIYRKNCWHIKAVKHVKKTA